MEGNIYMTMKKILSLNLLVMLLFVLTSCSYIKIEYKYMHNKTEIESVQIVEAYYDATNSVAHQNVIQQIEDYNTFLDEIEEIYFRFGSIFKSPAGISKKQIAVKINYKNGDYEVFDHHVVSRYEAETDFYDPYCDQGIYDKKEFLRVLSKYLNYELSDVFV